MGCCISAPSAGVVGENPLAVTLSSKLPRLTFQHQVMWAWCPRVVDGDTVILNAHTPVGDYEFLVRLSGIDSPELKSHDPVEKQHAQTCKRVVERLLLNKFCLVEFGLPDKYGRNLGNLFIRCPDPDSMETHSVTVDDVHNWRTGQRIRELVHVNTWLTHCTPVVEYTGGTKQQFDIDLTLRKYHALYRECFQQPPQAPSRAHARRH